MIDDAANWARAQARLDRVLSEPPNRQAARRRYDRRAVRFVVATVCVAVTVALLAVAVDPPPDSPDDPPAWRLVAGIVLLVLAVAVLGVRLARPYGSRPRLAVPLASLSKSERAELLRTVRGRTPAAQDRLALARLQAENMLERRLALAPQAGLAVAYLGGWTVVRSAYVTVMAAAFTLLICVSGVLALRDGAAARRFLEQHPYPGA